MRGHANGCLLPTGVYYHDNRLSELNVLLVYPANSKLKYCASEADCRASTRSLFPSLRTSLSLSLSLSVCKTQIYCFSNCTCKYRRNHSSVIVFILCVAYLVLSDDGTIINNVFGAD